MFTEYSRGSPLLQRFSRPPWTGGLLVQYHPMKIKASPRRRQIPSRPGEPTWEVAQFYPPQGEWTEADYLGLQTNHLVELSDGVLELLPMPTHQHQMIVAFLYGLLKTFVDGSAPGVVLFAPLRVRLWEGKFREP